MGFLIFTLHLIDFLAWPVIALGYPICASIRAIETGSEYHMRKLVTYWTIFSFISLFEHVFEKLIEWVPLWSYIKLIAICWLVIPEFNSACYFYQHLVHPCLPLKLHDVIAQFYGSCYETAYLCSLVNRQTFTDWFNKPMEDPSLKTETFLDVGERYLEENGSDPLVKLIANKTAREGSGPVWEDIKVMEHMAKHEAAEPKQVEGVKENQIHIEKETVGMQVEEMVVPADTEEFKLPEITCTVCQQTTTSEHNLKSCRRRRRRKVKCEELKTCKLTAKSEGSSPVTTKSNQLNQAQLKHAAAPQSEQNTNEAADPKQTAREGSGPVWEDIKVMEHMAKHEAAEPKQVEGVKENQIHIEKETVEMQVEEMVVPADTKEFKLPEITCTVCQLTTTSEHNLKSCRRRRRKVKCEELKTCKQTAKSEGSSPVTTKSNQLNQAQVKHAAAPQSEQNTNEAADPKQTAREGSGPVWEDIKVMEHMAKHEAAEPKQENQIHIEKEMVGMQVEDMVFPADTEEFKLPENICTVCQLTTASEHTSKSRRRRMRRKVKCEELKTCKQTAKSEGNSPVTTKSNQLNQVQVKHAAAPQSEQNTNEAADPKQVNSVEENLVQVGKKTTGVPIKEITVQADNTKEIKLRETNSLENIQKEWTCALCQVTTNSEHVGRNHREKCEELKTCKKKAKAERNFKQEQVEHALAPQITRSSTNEKPKEKVQLGATEQYEKQKQVKNAVGVTDSSKLWCRFCNVKCLSEIDLAAILKGGSA